MVLLAKATTGIATQAEGSFTNCVAGNNEFELSYHCQGPACSSLDGSFLDVTCHHDGSSRLICSNAIKCEARSFSYQSNFTFSQNQPDPWSPVMENEPDTWVPQHQHVLVADCARFSVTSDGTKQGTQMGSEDFADSCPQYESVPSASDQLGQFSTSMGRSHAAATQRPLILAGTGLRCTNSMASIVIAFVFAWLLVLPGATATALHRVHEGYFMAVKEDVHERASSDNLKAFAEEFRTKLAQRMNREGLDGESLANELVGNVISSVCGGYYAGSVAYSFAPTMVKNCISSVYDDHLTPRPGNRFHAVFGASLLCNYVISEAYPDLQSFSPDACESVRVLIDWAQRSDAVPFSPVSVATSGSGARHEALTSQLVGTLTSEGPDPYPSALSFSRTEHLSSKTLKAAKSWPHYTQTLRGFSSSVQRQYSTSTGPLVDNLVSSIDSSNTLVLLTAPLEIATGVAVPLIVSDVSVMITSLEDDASNSRAGVILATITHTYSPTMETFSLRPLTSNGFDDRPDNTYTGPVALLIISAQFLRLKTERTKSPSSSTGLSSSPRYLASLATSSTLITSNPSSANTDMLAAETVTANDAAPPKSSSRSLVLKTSSVVIPHLSQSLSDSSAVGAPTMLILTSKLPARSSLYSTESPTAQIHTTAQGGQVSELTLTPTKTSKQPSIQDANRSSLDAVPSSTPADQRTGLPWDDRLSSVFTHILSTSPELTVVTTSPSERPKTSVSTRVPGTLPSSASTEPVFVDLGTPSRVTDPTRSSQPSFTGTISQPIEGFSVAPVHQAHGLSLFGTTDGNRMQNGHVSNSSAFGSAPFADMSSADSTLNTSAISSKSPVFAQSALLLLPPSQANAAESSPLAEKLSPRPNESKTPTTSSIEDAITNAVPAIRISTAFSIPPPVFKPPKSSVGSIRPTKNHSTLPKQVVVTRVHTVTAHLGQTLTPTRLVTSNTAEPSTAVTAFPTRIPNVESIRCPSDLPNICGDSCLDTSTDSKHCRGCSNHCSGTCMNGKCLDTPRPSQLQLPSTGES